MKTFNILVTKETRAGELRVSLIPNDVQTLVNKGHKVFVEQDAGKGAGFSDQDYQQAGAVIRYITGDTLEAYQHYFKNIDVVVRAKRPERSREIFENKAMSSGTIMIGALDPLEKNSSHIDEYHHAGIIAYSTDQLNLSPDDPMNLLAAMSKIAGRLALLDAIKKFHSPINIKKFVIIGFGTVGRAAFAEAMEHKLPTLVILSNPIVAKEIETHGGKTLLLDSHAELTQQQQQIKNALIDADLVITSARKANQPAPLLIPHDTLQQMQRGSVIVDLALSEGGNVEGSEHDATHLLGNGIIVTNTSGYPKSHPAEASQLWSTASLHFILLLAEGKNIPLLPC